MKHVFILKTIEDAEKLDCANKLFNQKLNKATECVLAIIYSSEYVKRVGIMQENWSDSSH